MTSTTTTTTTTTATITAALRAAIDLLSATRETFAAEVILREYDEVLDLIRAAIAATDHDAVRIMQTVIQKGHDYVLIVEPRDGGSRFQIHNRLRDIEVARMLERFARQARDDARFGGDE